MTDEEEKKDLLKSQEELGRGPRFQFAAGEKRPPEAHGPQRSCCQEALVRAVLQLLIKTEPATS